MSARKPHAMPTCLREFERSSVFFPLASWCSFAPALPADRDLQRLNYLFHSKSSFLCMRYDRARPRCMLVFRRV